MDCSRVVGGLDLMEEVNGSVVVVVVIFFTLASRNIHFLF